MAFDGLAAPMFDGSHSAESLNVAIRFVIARIHTQFQLGEWQDPVGFAPVRSVQKVCYGIWVAETLRFKKDRSDCQVESAVDAIRRKSIPKGKGNGIAKVRDRPTDTKMMQDEGSIERPIVRYLLVGETGDVISKSEWPGDAPMSCDIALSDFHLRQDWHAYLKCMMEEAQVAATEVTLLDRVRTKNPEDYPRGIARTWLDRMKDSMNADVVRVAKRYILSNVVLNR